MRTALIGVFFLTPLMALAGAKSFNVAIDGMTCGSCVQTITEALSKLPDVDPTTVRVVLKENKATLTVKDEKPETVAAIKKAVEGAGYKVTAVNTIAPAKAK